MGRQLVTATERVSISCLRLLFFPLTRNKSTAALCKCVRVCVSYLVAVYSVLGRPGGDGDGVRLAAAVSLTVSIFASLPAQTHDQNEMSSVLRSLANTTLMLQMGQHVYNDGASSCGNS